jgi:hypothetical protein
MPHNESLVVTGRQRFAKAKRVLPEIQPAKLAKCLAAFDEPDWIFELTYDGFSIADLHRKRAVPRSLPPGATAYGTIQTGRRPRQEIMAAEIEKAWKLS